MDHQIPEVKAEVNKEEERDRKGGGFWGNFTSKLGGNFSGATGGAGTGLGGIFGGGVLATKAGLVGLILVGTTVAGGLGLVGYKVMGGGSSGDGEGTYSIFEAKPKGAEGSEASASAGKGDGTSDSLGMLHKANLGEEEKKEDEPAEAAPTEPVVNAVAGSAIAPVNHGSAAPSAAPKLGGGPRIGALSSGGGGSGGGSSASSAGTNMPGLVASGGRGSLSGMNRSDGRAGGGGRGVSNARRRGGASRQLGNVFRDQRGARSSASAGRTYDGGGQTAGSAIGPEGGAIQGGAGQGNRGNASMNQPNPETNPNINDPPPPAGPGKDVTPWADALSKAQMYLGAGMALLFLASKISATGPWAWLAKVLGAAAAVLGAMAMKIGFDIAFGEFGQPLQGAAMLLGGGFLVAAGASVAIGSPTIESGTIETLMDISKYAALGAIAVTFLTEPKVIKPGDKDYDRARHLEDSGEFGLNLPSERALEKFLIV